MKITSFRAKNFRAFTDTGHIELVPINILVGKNSIGKSSLARLWPLFNQGTGLRKRSPIIWSGSQVDFGSFKEVISRYRTNDHLSFEFKFLTEVMTSRQATGMEKLPNKIKSLSKDEITVNTEMSLALDNFSTVCRKLQISTNGKDIEYLFNETGQLNQVILDGKPYKIDDYYTTITNIEFIFPHIDFYIENNEKELILAYSKMRMSLWSFFRSKLHMRLSNDRIHDIVDSINIIGSPDDVLEYLKTLPYEYKSWIELIENIETSKKLKLEVHEKVIMASCDDLLRDLDNELRSYFSSVNYIQPIRATAQRDYRKQELAIDSIDSRGENLAFFLESLSESRLNRLNKWLEETLDFKIFITKENRYVMIVIEDIITGRKDNITDMGFGFSQVLPLAIQAWIASTNLSSLRNKRRNEMILVWEQPELHLHPAMQRKLARLIAKTISINKNRTIKFVIETHSQSIINEMGDLIVLGDLDKDAVQVILFEQGKNQDKSTQIKNSHFDTQGQLSDWPYGFLSV